MQLIMRRGVFALLIMSVAVWMAGASAAAAVAPLSPVEAARLLRQGGVALLLRHGQTVPGIGDPEGFRLDDCRTQRNLSDEGRKALRAMSSRMQHAGIRFSRLLSSQWCRCRETAQSLAAANSEIEPWPALNSQFSGNPVVSSANAEVIERLRGIPGDRAWLLVTHQVNVLALTGVSPESGEGVLVRPRGVGLDVLGRVKF